MKKLLSIFLAAILIFSCISIPVSAKTATGVIGELALDFFANLTGTQLGGDDEEEEEPLLYGILYEMESDGVTAIYTPLPTVNFDGPGTFTITADVPTAIDYEFLCWRDEDDNEYYPGEKIFVNGQITLYARWIPKTDNDIRIIRVIKTCVDALNRYFKKVLGMFETATDIYENFEPTPIDAPRYCNLTCSEVYYEKDTYPSVENVEAEQGMIFFYVDPSTALSKGLTRVINSGKCTVYFCSDWDKRTAEPVNKKEYTDVDYVFADQQGYGGTDIIRISGIKAKDNAYASTLVDADTYYMVVTISDAVYYAPISDSRTYPIYSNPISYVFTLTK